MAIQQTGIWSVIQARLGSTRLAGKTLADLGGEPMIAHVVARAEQIGYPACVAIPYNNSGLARLCLNRGWTYTEGPEEDVLARITEAARILHAEHIIRVTADCPFLDVEAARWTVAEHLETGADLTRHIAEGRGIEVFTREALEESEKLAPRAVGFYREHPDEWILSHPGRYSIHTAKFSVDTIDDLERARRRL